VKRKRCSRRKKSVKLATKALNWQRPTRKREVGKYAKTVTRCPAIGTRDAVRADNGGTRQIRWTRVCTDWNLHCRKRKRHGGGGHIRGLIGTPLIGRSMVRQAANAHAPAPRGGWGEDPSRPMRWDAGPLAATPSAVRGRVFDEQPAGQPRVLHCHPSVI
jgi:hypothetical protein